VEFYCILIIRALFYVCLRTQKQIVRSLNNIKYEPNNTDQYQTVTMTVTFCSCMICPPTSTSVNQVLRPHPVNKTRNPPPHSHTPLSQFPRQIEPSTRAWLARNVIRLLSLLCHSFKFKKHNRSADILHWQVCGFHVSRLNRCHRCEIHWRDRQRVSKSTHFISTADQLIWI